MKSAEFIFFLDHIQQSRRRNRRDPRFEEIYRIYSSLWSSKLNFAKKSKRYKIRRNILLFRILESYSRIIHANLKKLCRYKIRRNLLLEIYRTYRITFTQTRWRNHADPRFQEFLFIIKLTLQYLLFDHIHANLKKKRSKIRRNLLL